ncbi:MAG: serine/threonine-protein kinase [bacterium]
MSSPFLPGFQVLDTLRQTSKTLTVKAVQVSLERTVSVTCLRSEQVANPSEVRRFLGIARVCAQIKADGLPQIYDIASHGNQPYIIMEHVEGLTLAELVRQNGPLPVAMSVRVACTIADALNHAWKQSRLVHRNLKPSEIRIDDRGTPKLTDFGRATVILPDGHPVDEEEPGVIVGTPNFLSPEQVQGTTTIDCRADIYALGATLYYMITGHVPFPDCDPETVIQKQLTDQIPHPRTFRPDLPASISGLITRMLMKLPDDRYADWTEAMGDMKLALKSQPLHRRDTPPRGISTVSAGVPNTTATPAPELPQLRNVNARTPGPTPAAPAAMPGTAARKESLRRGLSPIVRVTLWLLLGIWFVLLGNDRLGNPLALPLPSPLLPLDAWLGTGPAAPAPRAAADNPPPPVAPPVTTTVAPATPEPSLQAVPPVATPAPPAKPVVAEKPPEPEKPRLPQTLPPEMVRRLGESLARGDLAGARALLAAGIPMDPARLAEFRSALAAIPEPLALAEQTILASRGQEMAVAYLGKDRKIIPRNIANGEIDADFVTADGNRPVTLKLSKFTADELLKLLPQAPETPAAHAAVCLALLKANRKADIAAHVPDCGVLGPLFEAAATP